ncbi:MAG TPA: hypothetical protein VGG74_25540 [Kofleriaceae bacterium]|jgi:hypothetical protein
MRWLVALGLAVACTNGVELNGVYTGTVEFSGMAGDCVPSTLTLSFQNDQLVSVAGGSSTFAYPSATDPYAYAWCTAMVTDGNGDVTCQYFEGDGSDCGGVLGELGTTTLALSDNGLAGALTTDVSLTAPSTNCMQQTECSGTGTVTFTKR